MSGSLLGIITLWLITLAVLLFWWRSVRAHRRRIDGLDIRVHVNGIRGKSTVTRLVAAVLREGGLVTVAKTTGSAARVIGPLGEESPIKRLGAPTINEQVTIVQENVTPQTEALVLECMAVRPLYQSFSQEYIVQSDVTIITNVREDHQDEMGETLEEIANSMAVTTPRNGLLITAEERPELRAILEQHAIERGSEFMYADPATVDDEDMQGFDYLQFKENVAIGLALADHLGISRSAAIAGMTKSVPDIGVVRLKTYDIRGKKVTWVPMFAANDKESVVMTLKTLSAQFPKDSTVIGLLNNRADRGRRAELFAEMSGSELRPYIDQTLLCGAYEDSVEATILAGGVDPATVHRQGDTVKPSLDQLLDYIAGLIDGDHGVLIGMVNIHTHQAEMLLEYFAEADGDDAVDELAESLLPERQPAARNRLRWAVSHRRRELTPAAGESLDEQEGRLPASEARG